MGALQSEISASSVSAGDSHAALTAVQSELTPLVDDVISLSQHLCAAAGIPFTVQDITNNLRASMASGNNTLTINHNIYIIKEIIYVTIELSFLKISDYTLYV